MPLSLWPGLAADRRLFEPLLGLLPSAEVPEFIPPERGEPLRAYAARYARTLGPTLPADGRYVLGGFSFGGQLALELAAVLEPRPRGLVLICGVRGAHQILPSFKRQQKMGALLPAAAAKRAYVPFARRFAAREGLDAAATELLVAMARDIDPPFLNWSAAACATWPGPPDGLDVPIQHIHGELDRIIPDVNNEADETIPGARHLITLTHPAQVAAFVAGALDAFDDGNPHSGQSGSPANA
ncbi:MAG: alpha/beta hydrolase [Planctomycetota bacterium]